MIDPKKLASIVDQRLSFPLFDTMHASDDDFVITASMDMFCAAFKARCEIRKYWHSVRSFLTVHVSELAFASLCETVAQVHLLTLEDVDREIFRSDESVITHRIEADTPEYEGWIDGNGIEAADRYPNFVALPVKRRNHTYAGREGAQRPAKLLWIYFRAIYQAFSFRLSQERNRPTIKLPAIKCHTPQSVATAAAPPSPFS